MNKRFLFVGMAAILGASLVFFACDSSTEGSAGAAGAPGPMPPATLPAGATSELLQAYYDSGVSKVFMVATPATAAGTFTVPKGKTLAVVGTVSLGSVTVTIDAYYGTLDVSKGHFSNASATTVFIVPEAKQPDVKAAAPGSAVPAVVTDPDPATPATGDVILANLTLGTGKIANTANLEAFAGAHTIYVPGTITVTGTFGTGNANLEVLGEMRAGGTGETTLTLGANTKVNKLTATSATLAGELKGVTEVAVSGAVTFSGAAKPGKITVNGGGGKATFSGEAAPTGDVKVNAGGVINIPDGGKLTVAATGKLDVDAGATIEVKTDGTLALTSGSSGRLDGTVTVESGGEVDDAGGGSLWDGDTATGQFVLSKGAKASIGGTSYIAETGALLNLTSGTLTMIAKGYVLAGELTVDHQFSLNADRHVLTIKSNGKLTTANGSGKTLDLYGATPAIRGETGAKIAVAADGDIKFTGTATDQSNFYASATPNGSPLASITKGTYNWSDSAGNNKGGWVKTGS
jgi:hypothetical protein